MAPQDWLNLLDPSILEPFQFPKDLGFKTSEDATIHPFYLIVSLGVGHCGPSYIDLLFVIEVDKHASRELGAVVGDDRCRGYNPRVSQGTD